MDYLYVQVLMATGIVLTLEDCFCLDLQGVAQAFFFTLVYSEVLLV